MKALVHAFASLLVLIFTMLLIYYQFDFGLWNDRFYYDGDNITLALVIRSMLEGEPFRWVFSSQTFIFPEGPLFALSYLITSDYKTALLTNAYLNLGLVLFSVFLISEQLNFQAREKFISLTLLLSLILVTLCLEAKPDVNGNTIFTPILFSTYYSGVIIISLFQIWTSFLITKVAKPAARALILLSIVLGGLTYASTPLYFLQFLAPMFFISLILTTTSEEKKFGFVLFMSSALSLAVGLAIREITSTYIMASVDNYINLKNILNAVSNLFTIINESRSEAPYSLLWILWCGLYLFQFICLLNSIRKHSLTTNTLLFFIAQAFFVSAPIITFAGVILSGNYLTRYLLPLPLFTLIGSTLLFVRVLHKTLVYALSGACVVISMSFILFQLSSNEQPITSNQKDSTCFNSYASQHSLQPVGGYWTSRYLTLYGPNSAHVWQVNNDLRPYNWLSNIHDHKYSSINAVIVEHSSAPFHISKSDVLFLGAPNAIYPCHQFEIYFYDEGSHGKKVLNERIRS